jgi:hypothetical protein
VLLPSTLVLGDFTLCLFQVLLQQRILVREGCNLLLLCEDVLLQTLVLCLGLFGSL